MDSTADRLQVYYPHGGLHLLLYWFTSHDRGHVIVARTESALRAAFAIVCKEEPYAEVRGCWRVDIVAPSRAMQADYATWRHEQRVREFQVHIGSRAKTYVERRGVLPRGLTRCKNYTPTLDLSEEEDREYAAESAATHRYCANCYEGIVPVGMTWEACYERKRVQYERLCTREYGLRYWYSHTRSNSTPRVLESRAPVADDADVLGVVLASHGAHAAGTFVEPCRVTDEGRAAWVEDALFYFRNPEVLDATSYREAMAVAEAVARAEVEAAAQQQKQANARRLEQSLGFLDELFG